ncbi:hypothetical protein BJ508DRAFT_314296 [Ascobolus immersus RN42]|uniref:Uncharacterized protein n=1 Tax=Ascobolus immersus RN42 TaxID=1160509 RepID=A0A3N4HFJ7_ASCIM|nr:hypothetical protein BJ508DRAFT_314296 [Ascobolus immersus RN42]
MYKILAREQFTRRYAQSALLVTVGTIDKGMKNSARSTGTSIEEQLAIATLSGTSWIKHAPTFNRPGYRYGIQLESRIPHGPDLTHCKTSFLENRSSHEHMDSDCKADLWASFVTYDQDQQEPWTNRFGLNSYRTANWHNVRSSLHRTSTAVLNMLSSWNTRRTSREDTLGRVTVIRHDSYERYMDGSRSIEHAGQTSNLKRHEEAMEQSWSRDQAPVKTYYEKDTSINDTLDRSVCNGDEITINMLNKLGHWHETSFQTNINELQIRIYASWPATSKISRRNLTNRLRAAPNTQREIKDIQSYSNKLGQKARHKKTFEYLPGKTYEKDTSTIHTVDKSEMGMKKSSRSWYGQNFKERTAELARSREYPSIKDEAARRTGYMSTDTLHHDKGMQLKNSKSMAFHAHPHTYGGADTSTGVFSRREDGLKAAVLWSARSSHD